MNEWKYHFAEFESDILNNELNVSPWSGHRNFVYDLTAFLKPTSILELGTHYGCSFFAFCQAVKDFKLTTSLIALDSWQGDAHAGYYGEEVFNLVKNTVNSYFVNLNIKLSRGLFIDALDNVEDQSIDIIHIDGLHTYEAVSEDFHNWLPKLRENGIILFHDIAEYTGYGSHTFWEEIKKEYPHFEFNHSWGLGILFPKGLENFNKLKNQDIDQKILVYTHVGNLELSCQRLKRDFRWQKEQTDLWWGKYQQSESDRLWETLQKDLWWNKYNLSMHEIEILKTQNDQLDNDLQWQREQKNLWWEKAQEAASDLEWQQTQTNLWWGKAEKLAEDLEWQKTQTNFWWGKAGKLAADLEWQETQTHLWWEKAVKLATDLEWQESQTHLWWGKFTDLNEKIIWQEEQTGIWWNKYSVTLNELTWQRSQTDLWWEKAMLYKNNMHQLKSIRNYIKFILKRKGDFFE